MSASFATEFQNEIASELIFSLSVNIVECEIYAVLVANTERVYDLLESTALEDITYERCMAEVLRLCGVERPFHRRPHLKSPEHHCLQNFILLLFRRTRHTPRIVLDSIEQLLIRHTSLNFLEVEEHEMTDLFNFYNIVRLLLHLVRGDATHHRRRILEIGVQCSEGFHVKRVMGGGAKLLTRVRDNIIVTEGNVNVQRRPKRSEGGGSGSNGVPDVNVSGNASVSEIVQVADSAVYDVDIVADDVEQGMSDSETDSTVSSDSQLYQPDAPLQPFPVLEQVLMLDSHQEHQQNNAYLQQMQQQNVYQQQIQQQLHQQFQQQMHQQMQQQNVYQQQMEQQNVYQQQTQQAAFQQNNSGWVLHHDPHSSRLIYYNTLTGESIWAVHSCAVEVEDRAQVALSDVQLDSSLGSLDETDRESNLSA